MIHIKKQQYYIYNHNILYIYIYISLSLSFFLSLSLSFQRHLSSSARLKARVWPSQLYVYIYIYIINIIHYDDPSQRLTQFPLSSAQLLDPNFGSRKKLCRACFHKATLQAATRRNVEKSTFVGFLDGFTYV